MWNTREMLGQNACGNVKCESTFYSRCKNKRKHLCCWNICRPRACMCNMHFEELWLMKKLIFLILVVNANDITVEESLSPKVRRESAHCPKKYSVDFYLYSCCPPSVWLVTAFPHRLKILDIWMNRSWLCTQRLWSFRRVHMQGAKEKSWRACKFFLLTVFIVH